MADVMGYYPSEFMAERACNELSEPGQWGVDITWQLGEPVYWYRVEHRTTAKWAVVRRVRGEGL